MLELCIIACLVGHWGSVIVEYQLELWNMDYGAV